jgi:translation initiation factor 3 subunit A
MYVLPCDFTNIVQRYYNLVRSQSKPLTEAEQTKFASFVLLSALAIPVINSTRSKAGLLEIDDGKHKQTRLSVLLSMGRAPSRAFLLKEAVGALIDVC